MRVTVELNQNCVIIMNLYTYTHTHIHIFEFYLYKPMVNSFSGLILHICQWLLLGGLRQINFLCAISMLQETYSISSESEAGTH